MDPERLERLRRISHGLAAVRLGFSEDEAAHLAFWRWLARQRGETNDRVVLFRAAPTARRAEARHRSELLNFGTRFLAPDGAAPAVKG